MQKTLFTSVYILSFCVFLKKITVHISSQNLYMNVKLSFGVCIHLTTVEPVYIEHSQEMKKCSMYAGVQCIQVLNIWRSGEI